VCRVWAATVGRISTENIYSVSRSIISTRATGWYSTRGIFIYITCIKKREVYISYRHTCTLYVQCAQGRRTRVVYTLHTYIARNGHGRLWRLIAAGCNTEVFHGRNHCFRPLRPRERRGYCLDFFAVIAMTAIHDEDPLDMVCDARRIKSVGPVRFYQTRSKVSAYFPMAKTSPKRFRIFLSLRYFKLDSSHILFLSFLYMILYRWYVSKNSENVWIK